MALPKWPQTFYHWNNHMWFCTSIYASCTACMFGCCLCWLQSLCKAWLPQTLSCLYVWCSWPKFASVLQYRLMYGRAEPAIQPELKTQVCKGHNKWQSLYWQGSYIHLKPVLAMCVHRLKPVWQVWRSNMTGVKQCHGNLLSNGKVEYAACLGYISRCQKFN